MHGVSSLVDTNAHIHAKLTRLLFCHYLQLHDIPGGNFKSSSPGIKKEELLSLQANSYSPVYAKWTTERCAVCRWVEDWDYNKIIICNRCQIAVHQECYGARVVQDLTNWVCRACELPQQKKECCLCPVKGILSR
ncbi:unnamed protein product [Triticum turgidum subsp. durum]|uniref:PHD-type domain-containing protein n=1 Tax=Triticum turgidum subsp. durum TaxID=4567 RepID=A0A9R1QDC1_TRITD|nr:unnamed protein product [Triticum turgidum subsp. durum]